jgi:hypothetical protein
MYRRTRRGWGRSGLVSEGFKRTGDGDFRVDCVYGQVSWIVGAWGDWRAWRTVTNACGWFSVRLDRFVRIGSLRSSRGNGCELTFLIIEYVIFRVTH